MKDLVEFQSFEEARQAGIKYMIAMGRRQPAHVGHIATLKKIMDEGMFLIVGVGSTNTAEKANGLPEPKETFNPISNPLTFEQQKEQIKRAFPDKVEGRDYIIVDFPDLNDNPVWCKKVVDSTKRAIEINGRYPDISKEVAWHWIGKPEDKKTKKPDGTIALEYYWDDTFRETSFPVLFDQPHEGIGLHLSARQLRPLDLNNLTEEQKAKFADWEYIRDLANKARENNPGKALLERLPVTMFDLTLERLAKEKKITTKDVAEQAEREPRLTAVGGVPLPDFISAADFLNKSPKLIETARLKVVTSSHNQTVYAFERNIPNLVESIKYAKGSDVLLTPEMSVTGYAADDYHQWNKNNDNVWAQIQYLAAKANEEDPNLLVSVGAPWHYSDKTLYASDPEYNMENKPYNCQFFLYGGKVIAASAKSILADGSGEDEPHQFKAWPFEKGTVRIDLPDGSEIPFGKPIVGLEKDGKIITVTHEQCAEGWPGIIDANKINLKEFEQARHICQVSKTNDLGAVLNPSASKTEPSLNKDQIRMELAAQGSKVCGAYFYANALGSDGGSHIFDGTQIFAQDGKAIQLAERFTHKLVSCSSVVADIPFANKGKPDVVVKHEFKNHELGNKTTRAAFEDLPPEDLQAEENVRAATLWMRDYLQKQNWQPNGLHISLSGGKDSAMGAVIVSYAIEFTVKQLGYDEFFKLFPQTEKYRAEILELEKNEGANAALKFLKKKMLHFSYLPTENSGEITKEAARILIEGGTLPDGTVVEGIGGTFTINSVQGIYEEAIISTAGLNLEQAIKDIENEESKKPALDLIRAFVKQNPSAENAYTDFIKGEIKRDIMQYVNSKSGSNPILPNYIKDNCALEMPTWAYKRFDNALQNLQARSRVPTPWSISNIKGLIALVTSNASEAFAGYTTDGGDKDMGGANPIGGITKDDITEALVYVHNKGLKGHDAIKALFCIIVQQATAELRRKEEGAEAQTDEKDMKITYPQMDEVEEFMIHQRHTAVETFNWIMEGGSNRFPRDQVESRNIIARATGLWEAGAFKRYSGRVSPHMRANKDPHRTVRTTILGDHFRSDTAHLTLNVMAQLIGGAAEFESKFGLSITDARAIASRTKEIKDALIKPDFPIMEFIQKAEKGEFADSSMGKLFIKQVAELEKLNLKQVVGRN